MNVYYPPDWMNQLHDRAAGKGLGLYMPFRYAGVRLLLLKKTTPDIRARRTHHGESDDSPRWVLQKLDLEIKFFPVYPASFFLEAVSSTGAYRNGIYSPSLFPAALS